MRLRFALAIGFAMVWYIWWLAALSFAGLIGYGILHSFNYNRNYYVPVEEIARDELARRQVEGAT